MIRRLLADADLNQAIVAGVVRADSGIDFKRAAEVPLEALPDAAVLAAAARDDRVLVSHDLTTMPNHLRQFVRHTTSPGVIIVPQHLSIGKAIENVLLVCNNGGRPGSGGVR